MIKKPVRPRAMLSLPLCPALPVHVLLALCLAWPAAAQAQVAPATLPGDRPSDYSHAMPLTVGPNQSVLQLRLPRDVYLHARTADLRDLRLFDADDKPLAFALRQPVARSERSRRDMPVRIFAVQAARATGATGATPNGASLSARSELDLEVQRSADGAVLSVSARSRQGASSDGIDTLVLDLGPAAKSATVDALRFSLPPGVSSYSARVVLEVSDDLKQWDTVGDSDLAWLVNERTETLASDRMAFEARSFRYARLTWREGKPLKFAAISAESPLSTELAAPLERLLIQPSPGRFALDAAYRASLAIPVQRIGLELGQQNVVMPAQIGYYLELPDRHGGKTPSWQFEPVAAATFYQLNQGGKRRVSGDIAITPAHAAEWILRLDAPGAAAPALRLSWAPASVVFLASGKPPYRLAFGRAGATRASRPVEQVAPGFGEAELLALDSAAAGPLQVSNPSVADGPGAAESAAAAARLRAWALWAALLAGVGVLAFMAWRLLKQMK